MGNRVLSTNALVRLPITTKLKDLHAGLEAQEAMERVGFVESRGQRYWRGGYSIVSMEGDVVFR